MSHLSPSAGMHHKNTHIGILPSFLWPISCDGWNGIGGSTILQMEEMWPKSGELFSSSSGNWQQPLADFCPNIYALCLTVDIPDIVKYV
jgi:hypothetical protein